MTINGCSAIALCSSADTGRNAAASVRCFGRQARLLIKRDDQTGLAFGGNKTRKLEFLVAEARDQGAKTLISGGALQSNHCRQTAAAAARFGFKCILVLTGDKPKQASRQICCSMNCSERKSCMSPNAKIETEFFRRHSIVLTNEGMKPYLVPVRRIERDGCVGIYVRDERTHGAKLSARIGSCLPHLRVARMPDCSSVSDIWIQRQGASELVLMNRKSG